MSFNHKNNWRQRPFGRPSGPAASFDHRNKYNSFDDLSRRNTNSRNSFNNNVNLNKGHHYHSYDNRYSSSNSSSQPSPTDSVLSSNYKSSSTANSTPLHPKYFKDSPSASASSTLLPSAPKPAKELSGSNPLTGINPIDENFTQLTHNINLQQKIPYNTTPDPKKNYKVLYDPELDKSLSKPERKAKSKKIRFNGEGLSSSLTDPRKNGSSASHYFLKPNKKSKKFPFKQLPQPKFTYDKDSLGSPPKTDLVVWDLPTTTSEVYLVNFFDSFGESIKNMRFINDPENGVPLGIATFTFPGSPDKAMRSALKLLKVLKLDQPKVDGVELKIGLNDHENKLMDSKISVARDRLHAEKIKRDEEEKRQIKRKLEIEEQKRREVSKSASSVTTSKSSISSMNASESSSSSSSLARYKSNTTILSIRHRNKVVSGIMLPKDLNKYIKDRPYILIQDRYISTMKISTQDVKRFLNKYDWTRVLSDKTGFYVVFNSLKECDRCFHNEDGRKFFEFKMFMELAIPENFDVTKHIEEFESKENNISRNVQHDVVDEAANMLIKEFQTFLAKDIRERIIAPVVLDLLSHDHYPDLVRELKEKEAAEQVKKSANIIDKSVQVRQNALSVLAAKREEQQRRLKEYQQAKANLPSFNRKSEANRLPSSLPSSNKRKNLIPMQHALNYDDDSDVSDIEDEMSESATPQPSNLKREYEVEAPKDKGNKRKKLTRSFLYDSSSEEEDNEQVISDQTKEKSFNDMDVDKKDEAISEVEDEKPFEDIDYSKIEEKYQPTFETPQPVYDEIPVGYSDPFDLDRLRSIIRDEEDVQLAEKLFTDFKPASHIKNIEYWAWKQKDLKDSSVTEEAAEDGLEVTGPLSSRLECKTGSFKSEGYRKILDADKIEYLPHRRKIHKPLKTVQHDDEESGAGNYSSNQNNNNIQSSRVNRANNRRFAADISAQKQMIGSETDILNLNALTKRKKPVSFARSAIHNWGLYALEPIAAKEMIIEYVGESIRQQVAEHREKSYLKTGIGSSYLFRIDENTVIDATKKGGIARFINHCCNPSCTAKIIKVEGKKRIVIYALRDIEANEELTYDYKFERETNDEERIRCLCGAPGCKGYLN